MMAENVLENRVCKACKADVRPGSLFCYNCGSSVAPDLVVETKDAKGYSTSDLEFRGDINQEKNENNSSNHVGILEKPIEKPIEKPFGIPIENNAEIKDKQIPLKSAASIRQKSRTAERQTVQVVWETPQNTPNIWFIIASIALIVFTIVILLVMLYVR